MSTIIKSSSELRKNYNSIAEICRATKTPVFLTRNGTGDTVLMDIESYNRREDDLTAAMHLIEAERARMLGSRGYTIDEFEQNMREAILKGAALRARKRKMLKTGKLDSRLLEEIVFNNIKFKREEVLKRPGIGEDCAAIDFGDYKCVMSTDPITASASQIGKLAVHVSCNDIASDGVEPLGIMLSVMLPVGTTEEEVGEIMRQAGGAAAELGVEIIGGHTEITPAVSQPVIVSTAIGRAPAARPEQKVRPGDLVFMTKSAGLEGSGIIAYDHEDELLGRLSPLEIEEAKSYLELISVVKEGVVAGEIGFSAMHDVTEGGLLGAVWELCHSSGVGAEVWHEAIPVTVTTQKICGIYGIDPLCLISSGSMVIITAAENKDELTRKMCEAGVKLTLIGEVKEKGFGVKLVCEGKATEVGPPESDEIYRVR
ncbi:MAG: AIR synthase-related protein [Clostridiales bacterium]|nr:AIR synthase-related protein [Clostridiales bacterium]